MKKLIPILYFVGQCLCFGQPFLVKVGSSDNMEDGDTPKARAQIENSNTTYFASQISASGSSVSNQIATISLRNSVQMPAFTHAYAGQSYRAGTTEFGQNGTGTNTFRMKHFCTVGCYNLQLLFGNSASAVPGTNNIFVKAAVEDSSGNIYPVYFNGQRTVTIPGGGLVKSDVLAIPVKKGDYIWSRTLVWNTNGIYPEGQVHQLPGEWQSPSDLVDSGASGDNLGYSYMPLVIYGNAPATANAVAIVGDSIATGYAISDTYDAAIVTGLGNNVSDFGKNVPHVTLAVNATTFADFNALSNQVFRFRLLTGCNYVLSELGINGISNFSSLTNDAVNLWKTFKNLGFKVYQTTLTPYTTSSDSWATAANQTPTVNEGSRTNFNNIVRTNGFGLLDGFCEIETLASTNAGNGIVWRPGFTSDGLHPNSAIISSNIFRGLATMTNGIY